MALPQSAVSELLEALRTGEGVDLIRESVRMVMQELIEAEASEKIGAARYERTETRTNERNCNRPRLVSTQAGDLEPRIPKLREGSYFPVILEPRRRIDQALYAVVMEAYVHGVSTRSVEAVDGLPASGERAGGLRHPGGPHDLGAVRPPYVLDEAGAGARGRTTRGSSPGFRPTVPSGRDRAATTSRHPAH